MNVSGINPERRGLVQSERGHKCIGARRHTSALSAGHSVNRYVSGVIVTRNFQSCLYQYYLQQNADEMKESGLFTKKVPEWEKKFLESDLS